MWICRGDLRPRAGGVQKQLDGNVIENVKEFTYLVHVISNTDEVCYTEHRVSRANAKFNELRNVLSDADVNLRSRRKILEACVRSRLLYGISAWAPKEAEVKKLEIFLMDLVEWSGR